MKILWCIAVVGLAGIVSVTNGSEEQTKLPDYVVAKKGEIPEILKKKSRDVSVPLTIQDIRDIKILEQKFDQEKDCAGLAAVQVGISKRIIIFRFNPSPKDIERLKLDPATITIFPKTIWINPSYEGVGDKMTIAKEGCFSVEGVYGMVERFDTIKVKAYDYFEKKYIEKEISGYPARIVQHETDHSNGILFTDLTKDIYPIKEQNTSQDQN